MFINKNKSKRKIYSLWINELYSVARVEDVNTFITLTRIEKLINSNIFVPNDLIKISLSLSVCPDVYIRLLSLKCSLATENKTEFISRVVSALNKKYGKVICEFTNTYTCGFEELEFRITKCWLSLDDQKVIGEAKGHHNNVEALEAALSLLGINLGELVEKEFVYYEGKETLFGKIKKYKGG